MRILFWRSSTATSDVKGAPLPQPSAIADADSGDRTGSTNAAAAARLAAERPTPRIVHPAHLLAARTEGRGITTEVAPNRDGLAISLEQYANRPLPAAVLAQRIAVSADHGSWEQAELVAHYLRELGFAQVELYAPRAGETLYYSVAGSAALRRLEAREVDRVIAFCGNGYGALDVANQFAEEIPGDKVTRPPVYGDNLWKIVDSQRGPLPANVLCLGARLVDIEDNPVRALVRAFFDDPANLQALRSRDAEQAGVATTLVDPKPTRVEKRRLEQGIGATLALSETERQTLEAVRPVIYYQKDNDRARKQALDLGEYLRPSALVMPHDGEALPEVGDRTRIIYIADGNPEGVPSRERGFWRPSAEEDLPVYRADLARGIAWFAKEARHDALTLFVPSASLTDEATGGERNDVLRLFAKTFFTTKKSNEPHQVKELYGKSVRYVSEMLHGSIPAEVTDLKPRDF